jgi:hypothetical protein
VCALQGGKVRQCVLPAGGATGCPGAVVVLAAWGWHIVPGNLLHELRVRGLLGSKAAR